ncbi:MAG: cytochrome c3 family protein [Planctomycetes bacterium]|nr:cytochrome c3 family protein [Planctomycetota bacterium]
MIALMVAAAYALPVASAQAPQGEASGCVVCHGEAGLQLAKSTHARSGVTCTTCHGGVAEAMDKEQAHGDALRPLSDPLQAVEFCGGCHSDIERMRGFGLRTDQLDLYWSSVHGKRLSETDDAEVATCVDCHGSHGIFRASDPRSPIHKLNQVETCGGCHGDEERMGRYGLRADAPELFRGSVHGRALLEEGRLSSPACTDCHGSHGATPPRVEQVGDVCGQCHTTVQEQFERSPHRAAALAGSMEECVGCHGNHAISEPSANMLLVDRGGTCGLCHSDPNDPGRAVATEMHGVMARLDQEILETEESLRDAASKGLFLEREHGYLDEARGLRVRASSLTHAASQGVLSDLEQRCRAMIAQTREGIAGKRRALRDRKIFTGIFFFVVLLFVGVTLVYRREVYGRRGGAGTVGATEAANADEEDAG